MNIAVAVDMSGSVSDHLLQRLCSELPNMGELGDITVIPFDHVVHEDKVKVIHAGENVEISRVAYGGTSFDAPTNYVNNESKRDEFDVVIFLTDGECSQPPDSRIPRCWLLPPGHKLPWNTDEKVMILDDTVQQRDEV